jgi:hypothetical protein
MRLCAKLGVEHILVSADHQLKRGNIRKNVKAWLKKPNLGTVPLFMAGDKQYFHYAYLKRKENGLPVLLMGENPLEKTDFKTGFTGARQTREDKMAYSLSKKNKFKLLWYYTKAFVSNPSYFNRSILDTISAFISYYIYPHDYINLFDYIEWDEDTVNSILINEYNWELDPEYPSTWRIGDGTAPFYNYIYYMVAGFTENDTFRSNQIREGKIDRELALHLSDLENKPRFDAINCGIRFFNKWLSLCQITCTACFFFANSVSVFLALHFYASNLFTFNLCFFRT